jgi:site-specific DNA-cytosine methylase
MIKLKNVLSLFDGLSGGQLALTQNGIKYDTYYASEIDKYAIQVTQKNFPNTVQLGDVTKWQEWDIDWSSIDLIHGGSPCQGFSNAGKGLNFEDPRSKLFFVFVDILNHIRGGYNPNVKFLLENVRMKKEWLDVISEQLGVEPININSSLVSGALRNRFYWTNIENVQQPEDTGIKLQDILENGYTDRLKARALLESESRPLKDPSKMLRRYLQTGFTTIVYSTIDKWNTISKNNVKVDDIRYFTQTELERLMTVPDGYTSGLTRNQAASLLGNSWTIEVIKHIYKNLKSHD